MTKNKLKSIDVSKYTVTDTGQVLKMNKEVEVIQRPTYAELEKENAELKAKIYGGGYEAVITKKDADIILLEHLLKEQKELVEKYRQAVDKCLHITFMGGGCEVNTIGQYATLVDGYLTDVEGLARWKN